MRIRSAIYVISVMVIISSCGVPQPDYDKLKAVNLRLKAELDKLKADNLGLKAELDECKFGAAKIIAKVEKAYSEDNYSLARQYIELLYSKHPESPKNSEFKILLKTIAKKQLEESRRKEAEEKERIRLANLNNTGMWSVRYYVDGFGDPTEKRYITNTRSIEGTFSNSATQDSKLNVRLLINNSSEMFIQLYEYAGNKPVKTHYPDKHTYSAIVQDKNGDRLGLVSIVNNSDRLRLEEANSNRLHDILMKGGVIKLSIDELGSLSQYEFTIRNADWYENAYRKLLEKR